MELESSTNQLGYARGILHAYFPSFLRAGEGAGAVSIVFVVFRGLFWYGRCGRRVAGASHAHASHCPQAKPLGYTLDHLTICILLYIHLPLLTKQNTHDITTQSTMTPT